MYIKLKSPSIRLAGWGSKEGRRWPRLAELDELEVVINKITSETERALSERDLAEALISLKRTKVEKKGVAYVGLKRAPLHRTVQNYAVFLACKKCISIVSKKGSKKTSMRYTAEMSLIYTMALCITIASKHFLIGHWDDFFQTKIKDNISYGANKMCHMVQANYDNSPILALIRPHLVFSTKNTTQYVFAGTDDGDTKKWLLVSPHIHQKKAVCHAFCLDDRKSMGGLHVKITFTFLTEGGMAPFLLLYLI